MQSAANAFMTRASVVCLAMPPLNVPRHPRHNSIYSPSNSFVSLEKKYMLLMSLSRTASRQKASAYACGSNSNVSAREYGSVCMHVQHRVNKKLLCKLKFRANNTAIDGRGNRHGFSLTHSKCHP